MNGSMQHLLMSLWVSEREGETRDPALHGQPQLSNVDRKSLLDAAAAEGFVAGNGGNWRLSPKGEALARGLLRRHRLAERLLCDILELPEEEFEQSACRFEHLLSEHVTERICTLLGHPTNCPHGRTIPPGDCCRSRTRHVDPIVERLTDLNPGDHARVIFLAPQSNGNSGRLGALGLTPGVPVTLLQNSPCCVVLASQTEIALDTSVARNVFVSRTSNGEG